MGLAFGSVLLCNGGGEKFPFEEKNYVYQIYNYHTSSCKRIAPIALKKDDLQHFLMLHSSLLLICWQLVKWLCCFVGRTSTSQTYGYGRDQRFPQLVES